MERYNLHCRVILWTGEDPGLELGRQNPQTTGLVAQKLTRPEAVLQHQDQNRKTNSLEALKGIKSSTMINQTSHFTSWFNERLETLFRPSP